MTAIDNSNPDSEREADEAFGRAIERYLELVDKGCEREDAACSAAEEYEVSSLDILDATRPDATPYTGRTLRVLIKANGAPDVFAWGLTPERAAELVDKHQGDVNEVRVWAEDDPGQIPAGACYPTAQYPPVKPYTHRTVQPSPLWDSYMGIDSGPTAEMFTRAAELVRTQGHNAYGYDDPNPGISITVALRAVARARLDAEQFGYWIPRELDDLVDELENRLAGVLYLLGQAQGKPMNSMNGVPFTWETSSAQSFPKPAYHGRDDVVRLLTLAAGMAELVDASWPPKPPAEVHLASCGHPANEDGECGCSSWPERAPVESL